VSTEIYYFSGTGNSLAVARDIAGKLNGKLISIPSVIGRESIRTDSDVIGIVFPVYYVGLRYLPLIVQRFTEKLENLDGKYIFAVCTYGGGSGWTLKLLDELLRLRDGRLAAGFGVPMPQNAFDKPFENREKLCREWKEKKLGQILEAVNARRENRLETDPLLFKIVIDLLVGAMNVPRLRPHFIKKIYQQAGSHSLDRPFAEVMLSLDKSYQADNRCKGCGICSKVCPVANIQMADGKPVWLHHCENCLACLNWCPQKAIHGYAELPNQRRYHHPDVQLGDIMRKDEFPRA